MPTHAAVAGCCWASHSRECLMEHLYLHIALCRLRLKDSRAAHPGIHGQHGLCPCACVAAPKAILMLMTLKLLVMLWNNKGTV